MFGCFLGLSLYISQLKVECEAKTKDNVFALTVINVQYQVNPTAIRQAAYTLTDPQAQIRSGIIFHKVI